jgi:hypothetical protein
VATGSALAALPYLELDDVAECVRRAARSIASGGNLRIVNVHGRGDADIELEKVLLVESIYQVNDSVCAGIVSMPVDLGDAGVDLQVRQFLTDAGIRTGIASEAHAKKG